MISPEILRKFPFFFGLTEEQLKQFAMIAEEHEIEGGINIFEEDQEANKFYLLMDGSVDLFIKSEEENDPSSRREFGVGEINPGEIFGISSIVEPYRFRTTTRTAVKSHVLEFDGLELRNMLGKDTQLANQMMKQIAKSLMERLASTRVQLAAAWA